MIAHHKERVLQFHSFVEKVNKELGASSDIVVYLDSNPTMGYFIRSCSKATGRNHPVMLKLTDYRIRDARTHPGVIAKTAAKIRQIVSSVGINSR